MSRVQQMLRMASAIEVQMTELDAQILHVCTRGPKPEPSVFRQASDVIRDMRDEIFKLRRYCRKALTNAEDIASGRAEHLVDEIEEFIADE